MKRKVNLSFCEIDLQKKQENEILLSQLQNRPAKDILDVVKETVLDRIKCQVEDNDAEITSEIEYKAYWHDCEPKKECPCRRELRVIVKFETNEKENNME